MTDSRKISILDYDLSCSELHKLIYSDFKSLRQISREIGVSRSVINRWLKECSIQKKSFRSNIKINYKFFDKIDTEKKAYWLGYLWCDGYNNLKGRNGKRKNSLYLVSIDKDVVQKFKSDLNSDHLIKNYNSNSYSGYNEGKFREMYSINICNKYLSERLAINYGLIPHRTTAIFLKDLVPKNLMRHFIRGIIEADGSISICKPQGRNTKNTYLISFSTYKELIEIALDYFIEFDLIDKRKKVVHRKGDCYGCKIQGALQPIKILDHIYNDCHVYMNRKYNKYKNIMDSYSKR